MGGHDKLHRVKRIVYGSCKPQNEAKNGTEGAEILMFFLRS
jgi:hypothetical protein